MWLHGNEDITGSAKLLHPLSLSIWDPMHSKQGGRGFNWKTELINLGKNTLESPCTEARAVCDCEYVIEEQLPLCGGLTGGENKKRGSLGRGHHAIA